MIPIIACRLAAILDLANMAAPSERGNLVLVDKSAQYPPHDSLRAWTLCRYADVIRSYSIALSDLTLWHVIFWSAPPPHPTPPHPTQSHRARNTLELHQGSLYVVWRYRDNSTLLTCNVKLASVWEVRMLYGSAFHRVDPMYEKERKNASDWGLVTLSTGPMCCFVGRHLASVFLC